MDLGQREDMTLGQRTSRMITKKSDQRENYNRQRRASYILYLHMHIIFRDFYQKDYKEPHYRLISYKSLKICQKAITQF